jgi:hypothetical protein
MKTTGCLGVVLVATASLSVAAVGEQVYRWADDDKIMNVTTSAPPAGANDVKIIPIEPLPSKSRRSAAEVQAEIDRRVSRYHSAIEIMRDTRAAKLGISRRQLDQLEGRAPAR